MIQKYGDALTAVTNQQTEIGEKKHGLLQKKLAIEAKKADLQARKRGTALDRWLGPNSWALPLGRHGPPHIDGQVPVVHLQRHHVHPRLFGESYTDPMMESYTTLGYFAGLTEKAYLGVLVTGVIYRHPSVLMKTVNTLDILSGGRAYLGIGAAWYEEEAKGYGIRYPSTSERFELLEDNLKLAKALWDSDETSFDGKHLCTGNHQ